MKLENPATSRNTSIGPHRPIRRQKRRSLFRSTGVRCLDNLATQNKSFNWSKNNQNNNNYINNNNSFIISNNNNNTSKPEIAVNINTSFSKFFFLLYHC